MWSIYQILAALALLVAGPWLLLLRRRHYLPTVRGRLGGGGTGRWRDAATASGPVPAGGELWIHAVSVGEAQLAGTLAAKLPADLALLLTTITPTGQAQAAAAAAHLGDRVAVAYLPFELSFAIARFFRRFGPSSLVLVEGDFWPLLLRAVKRRGLPTAVVNGRVSDRSFPRLLRFRRLALPLFLAPIDRFGVQTALDAERLIALGVPGKRITVTGNLKFDSPAPPVLPELARRLERLAAGRPILVAGSTMAGEEEQVLAAFHRLADGGRAAGEQAMLVVAPRHPERFAAVAERLAAAHPGLVRRSGADRDRPGLFLLDSIGELSATYRLATAAFIGGTLQPTGGHNPIEAARFGVPVAVGPSMNNFREIAEQLDRAGAWGRVASGEELGRLWGAWLGDPAAARAVGERGRALVAANSGALDRTLDLLAALVAAAARAQHKQAGR
ncbi:MAG: glycosyltransferase N-terminal domain-containing protein [Thermoanaerobaculia bacterium]